MRYHAVPLAELQREYYEQKDSMAHRIGPLDDDITRLEVKSTDRFQWSPPDNSTTNHPNGSQPLDWAMAPT